MGKRGPARTPTRILELHGSKLAKYRLESVNPDPDKPCTAWSEADAMKALEDAGKWLADAEVFTELDHVAWRLLRDALIDYFAARALVEKHGLLMKGAKGNAVKNPAAGIRDTAFDRFLKLCREFGLTPSSRAGLDVPHVPSRVASRDRGPNPFTTEPSNPLMADEPNPLKAGPTGTEK